MKKAPRVIVGIVTRDRASVVRKAIDSALAQSFPNLAISVLNDGSVDETNTIAVEYPRVNWSDYATSRGCITARNDLMGRFGGDYFVSLDDDAWFLNGDEISVGINYLEAHPKVAAIAFDVLSPDKSSEHSRVQPRRVPMFIGCGHIVRLTAARAVGGYVGTPGIYGSEEKDLALRLMDAGYGIMLLPGVHVWHDKTAVAREQPAQHRSGVCNDLAMTLRRTPLMVLPLALASKFYRHFRFSRAHQLEEPFWGGVRLFCQSIPQIWRTRRPVRLATLWVYVKLSRQTISS
jgi:glycosyltransferase involved in cell wall biosynthesis